MRKAIFALSAAGLLLAVSHAQELASACDLSKVIQAFYCEDCDAVLEKKDLVSEKTVYYCEACDLYTTENGQCADCEGSLEARKTDKHACKDCFQKTVAAEACLKVYFECPDCGDSSAKSGTCADCEIALTEVRSLALVEYACPECGVAQRTAGKCSDKECDHFGKPLTKTCSQSGEAPHVAATKSGKN